MVRGHQAPGEQGHLGDCAGFIETVSQEQGEGEIEVGCGKSAWPAASLSFPGQSGDNVAGMAPVWLIQEPEPLVSGLAGRRVSAGVVDRFPAMIAELRAMDDVAGAAMCWRRLTLIDTAVAGTRGQQTPRLLAQLYIQQAHAFAALKDASACTASIFQARTHVEQSVQDDDPPYLYWVRPAEITASAGECLLRLGQADRAAALIDQGIALFDASFDRDRQYYLTPRGRSIGAPRQAA